MAKINQIWKYDYEEEAFPFSPSNMQEIVNGTNDLYEGTEELILKNVKSYNLLPNKIQSQTINGVTITRNKDGLLFNGTSTSAFYLYFIVNEDITLEADNYTLSTNKSGSLSANAYIELRDGNDETIFPSLNLFSRERLNETLIEPKKLVKAHFYIGANRTFTNFKISPMLQKGSEEKEYVPYFDLERLQNRVNEVVLFDNKNGSNADSISLTGDVTNAIDAEIYFKSNDGYCGYIKVDSPLNKIVNCSVDSVFNNIWYTKSTAFKIEKDKLSIANKGQIAKSSASTTITDASNIYVTKVVCHYRN